MQCRFIIADESHGLRMDIAAYSKYFPNNIVQFVGESSTKKCDINFYIEHLVEDFIDDAKINILMLNYEFLLALNRNYREKAMHALPKLHFMICKTQISVEWAEKLKREYNFSFEIVYTKHTSPISHNRIQTTDFESWLHIGGKSPYKNTDIVLSAWVKHPEWPTLNVICNNLCRSNLQRYVPDAVWRGSKNIVDIGHQDDISICAQQYQNHICPSIVEGYGHYINEARGYSRFIVATDYPPMNEMVTPDSGFLISCSEIVDKKNSPGVKSCVLTVEHFEQEMARALTVPIKKRIQLGAVAHAKYVEDTKFFHQKMSEFAKLIKQKINK